MFQKINNTSMRYKATVLAFIIVVSIKLLLRVTGNYEYMDEINGVIFAIIFLMFCFGVWDLNNKKHK